MENAGIMGMKVLRTHLEQTLAQQERERAEWTERWHKWPRGRRVKVRKEDYDSLMNVVDDDDDHLVSLETATMRVGAAPKKVERWIRQGKVRCAYFKNGLVYVSYRDVYQAAEKWREDQREWRNDLQEIRWRLERQGA